MAVEKLVELDLANLSALGAWTEDIQRNGNFSARRPDYGPMWRCPKCLRRHRVAGPRAYCSNTEYAHTKRAWDKELGFHQVETDGPRMVDLLIPKSMLKKLKHKRHGQNLLSKIRRVTLLLQSDEAALKAAIAEIREAKPHLPAEVDKAGIPAFTEMYVRWKWAQVVKKEHRQQSVSRRINRGLLAGGSR